MKKRNSEMRAEYDFSGGVRGKYAGMNIRIVGAQAADAQAEIDAGLKTLDSTIKKLQRSVKIASQLSDDAQTSISNRLKNAAHKLSRIADRQ